MVISGILRLLGLPHPPIALPYGFLSRSLESGAWLYPRIRCILPLGVIIIMCRGVNRVICHRWGGTGCREALVCFLPHYGAFSLRRYGEMRAAGIVHLFMTWSEGVFRASHVVRIGETVVSGRNRFGSAY